MKLNKLADFVNGYAFKSQNYVDSGLRVIRITNVQDGFLSDDNPCFYPIEFVTNLKNANLKENDLLMSLTGNVGRVAILSKEYLPAGLNQRVECIRPFNAKDTEYLYYYFRSQRFKNQVTSATTGLAQQNLSVKWLENHDVPYFEQNKRTKIVKELKNLDKAIKVKQEQLKALDELIKSQFISTFGTYPANQKKWKTGTIRDVVSDVQYGTSRPAVKDGDYPYLRMNNITYEGELDLTDIKYINVPEKELKKCSVKNGDVLFNRTNSKELVGKSCVYDRNELMILAGFIIRVRLNQQILPEFLVAFLNTDFSKKMLFNMCKKAIGQANINAQEMQNIGIYIPPISVQKKFVSYKSKIDKLKIIVREQIKDLQELLALKMDEYFR